MCFCLVDHSISAYLSLSAHKSVSTYSFEDGIWSDLISESYGETNLMIIKYFLGIVKLNWVFFVDFGLDIFSYFSCNLVSCLLSSQLTAMWVGMLSWFLNFLNAGISQMQPFLQNRQDLETLATISWYTSHSDQISKDRFELGLVYAPGIVREDFVSQHLPSGCHKNLPL